MELQVDHKMFSPLADNALICPQLGMELFTWYRQEHFFLKIRADILCMVCSIYSSSKSSLWGVAITLLDIFISLPGPDALKRNQ
jgi:hypothetical protein